jgi:teichuronic acid biosynthesis glycosyltransferase TuaC
MPKGSSHVDDCGLPDRLRILTLSTVFPNPGQPGRGRFVQERIRHMAAGADITVIAPVPFFDYRRLSRAVPCVRERQEDQLSILHPRWIYLPLLAGLNPLWLCLRLIGPTRRLRRSFRYHIIDSHFGFPDGCAAALLAWLFRCPFTITLRGSEVLHAKYALRRFALRLAFGRAGHIIAVSERLRQFAIALGVEPARVKVIPNGVDTTRFFPRDRVESRKKYGLPLDRKIVLSAGHLIELKGHHRVIRAVGEARAEGIDADLLIVGGAGDAQSYEQEIRQAMSGADLERNVRFLGEVPQDVLAELMSAADVFCLASSREGWPNVVHESLACGLPVVATNVGAIPEMIPSQLYGLIVPADDAPALGHALREALSREWDRNAIAAWGQSRSWHHVAQDVLQEIRQVLTEAHPHHPAGSAPREPEHQIGGNDAHAK